jgi:hypothetical protein
MKIELKLYSGRKNPTFQLRGAKLAEFEDRLSEFDSATLVKPAGLVHPLGYSGFTVTPSKRSGRPLMHIHSSRLDPRKSAELEHWLLGHMKLSPVAREHVLAAIPQGQHAFQTRDIMPRLIAPDRPVYQPEEWNTPEIQPNNNCYAYATNDPTNTFPQPGLGSGKIYEEITAEAVSAAAVRDGLKRLSSWNERPAKGWRVVLVIWPGEDYHWYREDFNVDAGDKKVFCSHKPGSTEVRNIDDSGKLITDPSDKACDHGPYTIVAGVFNVPGRSAITIA